MTREDKEALFMILERNGIRTILRIIEEYKDVMQAEDLDEAFRKFIAKP